MNSEKYYLVRLRLRIGEYEKHTLQLICATTVEEAELEALKGETHNQTTEVDDQGDWWDDFMVYEVDNIKELTAVEVVAYKALTE